VSDYDKAVRYAAKQLDVVGFLGWLLPGVTDHWRWAGWLDTRTVPFPAEQERTCDTVAALERLAGDAPPAAVVVEFELRARPEILERLAEYMMRVRRDLPAHRDPFVAYEVAGVVVNLTGPPLRAVWATSPPDLGGIGLELRTAPRTLREMDAAAVLAAIREGTTARCILPWIPLMSGADETGIIEEWKRLALAEPDERKRGDYGALARLFARPAGRADVWKAALEGWNMEVSDFLQEWVAKGRAAGLAEGVLSARRADLRRILERRFGPVPADLLARIDSQASPATLEQWLDQAVTAVTLDELRAAWAPAP
jgi:hypothetical protein